ncbi:hypothetical protein [Chitinophaga sp. CF418]|uniref:hypothetical protein n=1 Tax=Chitinophaga sp. CF418 TaxID=1855287 RepID=UPI00122C9470|nr:hypothetical protein [Chitinophaga sp. CF418]
MNKFNPFQRESPLFSFRWFIVFASLIGGLLFYSDTNGWRLFSGSGQERWSASGQHGYHK